MKGTLFSSDYIQNENGDLKLLEFNTDTGFVSSSLYAHFSSADFINVLNTNSIDTVEVIYKPSIDVNFVTWLQSELAANAPFITSVVLHEEDVHTIYPTSVTDSDNKFILRMAYDESALFDSVFCKSKIELARLFTESEYSSSYNPMYFSSSLALIDTLTLEPLNNSDVLPDLVYKPLSTQDDIKFVKLGKPDLTDQERLNDLTSSFNTNEAQSYFIEKFVFSGSLSSGDYVESIRSYDIIYGTDLDIVNLGRYNQSALLSIPTVDSIRYTGDGYSDLNILNVISARHNFEYGTKFPAIDKKGADGNTVLVASSSVDLLISSASVGDSLLSLSIPGVPNTDDDLVFASWSHDGDSLPSGSFITSSVIEYVSTNTPKYPVLIELTLDGGNQFNFSFDKFILTYQSSTNKTKYVRVNELTTNDSVYNLDGTKVGVTSVKYVVYDDIQNIYTIDTETLDNYAVSGSNAGSNISMVVHNCFVEGTTIKVFNGENEYADISIEDLELSHKEVVSFNHELGCFESKKYSHVSKTENQKTITIKFNNGVELECTTTHPLYTVTHDTYKSWDTGLSVGDDVLFFDTSTYKIIDIVENEELKTVYNVIDVEDNHNFYANGALAHNKAAPPSGVCFPAGTKVTTEDGDKNIEDIEVGEFVLSFNEETKETEYKKVEGSKQPIHNDLVKYKFSDGNTLVSTFDHPIYVNGLDLASFVPTWTNSRYEIGREVGKIKIGDIVRLDNGSNTAITEIEVLSPIDTQTYIITVEGNHNFYANGILVHNK